jgi:hypothetical protein
VYTSHLAGEQETEMNAVRLSNCFPRSLFTCYVAPLEKFTALLEDIFEAEDSLASDVEVKDLPPQIFSPLTVDCTQPLLNYNILHKLSKYIAQATRPSRRFRVFSRDGASGVGNTPRQTGRMADINYTMLSRVLKILDRSVRACEGVEPFRNPNTNAEGFKSPRKSNKKKGTKKNAQNPDEADEAVDGNDAPATEEPPPFQDPSQSDFEKLSWMLDVARESALAANCCIALLGSDRLTKQVSARIISFVEFYQHPTSFTPKSSSRLAWEASRINLRTLFILSWRPQEILAIRRLFSVILLATAPRNLNVTDGSLANYSRLCPPFYHE